MSALGFLLGKVQEVGGIFQQRMSLTSWANTPSFLYPKRDKASRRKEGRFAW